MSYNKIIAYITDNAVITTPGSLPVPGTFTHRSLFRGVEFSWSPTVVIKPYKWQYRFNVENDGWSEWTDLADRNTITRMLTTNGVDGEFETHGGDANIVIQVRSTDGASYSSTGTDNADCDQGMFEVGQRGGVCFAPAGTPEAQKIIISRALAIGREPRR